MYEKFYKLKEKPFNLLPDPHFLYLSKKHELALTYLEYGIAEQSGFIVITGEVGSGKTTLIKYLINQLENRAIKIAMIFNTNINPTQFLEIILKEWDISYKSAEKVDLYEMLNDFLIKEYIKKNQLLLIIDEAQNLPSATLEEIRMISNLNDEKRPLLHIILSGQPNLRNRLNQADLEQLRQRISIHYHLGSLDKQDCFQYIRHRLKKAGASNVDIFLPEAMESIYMYSKGIPRVINVICDTALVYGFAEERETIDKSIIEGVIEDRKTGGLIFVEDSPAPYGVNLHSDDGALSKEIIQIKEKYELLNENILELSLLVKKLYTKKDSNISSGNNEQNKIKKQLEREKEKNKHITIINRQLTKKIKELSDKIKSLEKQLSESKKHYPKIVS